MSVPHPKMCMLQVVLLLRDEEHWYASFKKMVDRGARDYGNLVYIRFLFPSLNRMLAFFENLLTGCVVSGCNLYL